MPRLMAAIPIPLHQFANQLLFLFVGKVVYNLSVTWVEIGLILLVSVLIEHAYILVRERGRPTFSVASLSTGFNLAFMLGSTWFGVYVIGLLVGLGQKHFFRMLGRRHFLNPSNLAIVVALLLYPNYTFVTFLDWGETGWFALLIAGSASLLLLRLGLLILPLTFLAAYSLFMLIFETRDLSAVWLQLNTAGFLLFAFFMLTDPRAIPESRPYRVMHALITALLCVVLAAILGPKEVNFFLALVLSSLLVPLWRHLETAPHANRRQPMAIAAGILLLASVTFYFSPWNLFRNSTRAFDRLSSTEFPAAAHLPADPALVVAEVAPERPGSRDAPITDATLVWGNVDEALYLAEWERPHVISRPLKANNPAGRPFIDRAHRIPAYPSPQTPGTLDEASIVYGAIAAGDLNRDGYLDVILAEVQSPLKILINDRRGGFVDATPVFFPHGAPTGIEHLALADFNNDTWLDLLIIHSLEHSAEPSRLHLFDPATRVFKPTRFTFGAGRHTSGGVTAYDLTGNKFLDFYVSYGIDWRSNKPDFLQAASPDLLVLGSADGWKVAATQDYGDLHIRHPLAGMTALFVDINLDGKVDFLLGNDFEHPSLMLMGGDDGKFTLRPPRQVENNAKDSMSYFAADFDSDGILEIWENGVAESHTPIRHSSLKTYRAEDRTLLNRELGRLAKEAPIENLSCDTYEHPLVHFLCRDTVLRNVTIRAGRIEDCTRIFSVMHRRFCEFILNRRGTPAKIPTPQEALYDVERYPKQLRENVLLKLDASGQNYRNILKDNEDAQFTGFTWAAYAFDINNNGYLDIYVGNGRLERAHDTNALLLNRFPEKGKIWFDDVADEYGVALEDNTRGLLIADFDLDGDGDLFVNNFMADAMYFENTLGGKAILVELRARHANYYAIGARLSLTTQRMQQTRLVTLGGHWNTSQPFVQHFGIAEADEIVRLDVYWPDGSTSSHADLSPGNRYVIYQ